MEERRTKDTVYYNLLEALAESGCALCRLGRKAASGYLQALFDEGVNDEAVQERFLASWGFCATHSEEVERRGHPLGVAILYQRLLAQLSRDLPAGSKQANWLGRLAGRGNGRRPFGPQAPCAACEQREAATGRYLACLNKMHDDPDLAAAVAAQDPLCLPHLQQAMERLDAPALEPLLARQQATWAALQQELAELIRKHDYRARGEPFGEERDAWVRAIRAAAGEQDTF